MKKRIISLLLAAAMTFSLTACGGNSSDDKMEETKQKTQTTKKLQKWIQFTGQEQ